MPRPSGKSQRIAEKVIPGLRRLKGKSSKQDKVDDGFLSHVELLGTRNIENKKGLKRDEKTRL